MEDVSVLIDKYCGDPNLGLFCVFDGHGGDAAAKACGAQFPDILAQQLQKAEPQQAMVTAFKTMDASLSQHLFVGCTAAVVLIDKKRERVFVANAGDSRVIASFGGVAHRLSVDHKPTTEAEHHRIIEAGGFITGGRVHGILSVSRAMGDYLLKNFVIAEPELNDYPLPGVEFVVIACDGLFDVVSDEEAVSLVRTMLKEGKGSQAAANALVKKALASGTTDNVSVVVVVLSDIEN